jgi:hypothetical protein
LTSGASPPAAPLAVVCPNTQPEPAVPESAHAGAINKPPTMAKTNQNELCR